MGAGDATTGAGGGGLGRGGAVESRPLRACGSQACRRAGFRARRVSAERSLGRLMRTVSPGVCLPVVMGPLIIGLRVIVN
jgi:hypothetical protein